MCFIILEHEQKPMKVHGERIIPATVIPLQDNLLTGEYVGVRTGLHLIVKSLGFLADAVPEKRPVFAAMCAIGVSLNEAGADADTNEVYLPIGMAQYIMVVRGLIFEFQSRRWENLAAYWLPAQFTSSSWRAEGWFRLPGEAWIVSSSDTFPEQLEQLEVTLFHEPTLCGTLLHPELIEFWQPQHVLSSTLQPV